MTDHSSPMTTWIETTHTKQDGTPYTRKIKVASMDETIWFTDEAYAEVADDVADILANNIDDISTVPEPSSPGEYYGDAGSNTVVDVVVADAAYDKLTVESMAADVVDTENARTETLAYDYSDNYPQYPTMPSAAGLIQPRPHPMVDNPVLSPSDATDASPNGLADPFLSKEGSTYHLFFEMISGGSGNENVIGHATSHDGLTWSYDQMVIDGSQAPGDHLAYPHVFKWSGEWYMTPANGDSDFQIWKADPFPTSWSIAEVPITTGSIGEQAMFRWNGRWWATFSDNGHYLYYSEQTEGGPTGLSWTAHSENPIESAGDGRLQGRPVVRDEHVDFFRRDNISMYRAHTLTTSTYEEVQVGDSPILRKEPNTWTQQSLHHIDLLRGRDNDNSIIVIDGHNGNEYSLGIYTEGERDGAIGKISATSTTTITDQATDGWQQVNFGEDTYFVENITPRYDLDEIITAKSGYHVLSGLSTFSSPTLTPFEARLRAENTYTGETIVETTAEVTANQRTIQLPQTIEWLEAGANIHFEVWQNSGGDQTIAGDGSKTAFQMHRVW